MSLSSLNNPVRATFGSQDPTPRMSEEVVIIGDPKGREKVVGFCKEEANGEGQLGFGFEMGGTGEHIWS